MFCACDIGNSRIKAGLFFNDELKDLLYFSDIKSLISELKSTQIDQFAVSSVVPAKQHKLASEINKAFQTEAFIIEHSKKFNLRLHYDSLHSLGVDRVCSLEGAYSLFKRSHNSLPEREFIISIDFGTATTINIIKAPLDFIGGIIAPGPKMMLRALQNHTAQLPKVNPENYSTLIAQDTKTSMASGVVNSTAGLVDKLLNHLYVHHNAQDLHIYITGGNAEYILPQFDFEFTYEKALVLYGIKAIFEKNRLKAGSGRNFHK
jgi:type III pantothenate kinase